MHTAAAFHVIPLALMLEDGDHESLATNTTTNKKSSRKR